MQLRAIVTFTIDGTMRYFSTDDMLYASTFYCNGRILDISPYSLSYADVLYGKQTIDAITVTLDNADGYFSSKYEAHSGFRGQTLYVIIRDIDASANRVYTTHMIAETECNRSQFIITAYPHDVTIWEKQLATKLITEAAFGSTSIHDSALNKPIPIYLGKVDYVPIYSIYHDQATGTHDFLIGYGTIGAIGNVYREGEIVPPSEYTFYDGSQGSPYAGYAFIRYASEQYDSDGNLLEQLIDITYGIKVDGENTCNIVRLFKEFLKNTTWGLSQTISTPDFATAETNIPYNGGCAIYETEGAASIRDKFLIAMNTAYLAKNKNNAWVLSARLYIETNSATFTKYNMKDVSRTKISANDYVKKVSLSYYPQHEKEDAAYVYKKDTGIYKTFGVEREYESPYTYEEDVGVMLMNRIKKTYLYQDDTLQFDTGADGITLALGNIILVDYPEIGITNSRYEIIEIQKSIEKVSIKAASYSPLIFA